MSSSPLRAAYRAGVAAQQGGEKRLTHYTDDDLRVEWLTGYDHAAAGRPAPEKPLRLSRPLRLSGPDGNAYVIMGFCQDAARRAGWPAEQIAAVMAEATSGNYDHLLRCLRRYFAF